MPEHETPQQPQQSRRPWQPSAGEPWEYDLHVPNDPRAVTVCRRTFRLILTLHGLIGLVDTAELLAAELVSNAVRHTEGSAALRVRWADGVLWIGAWDADPEPPGFPAESDDFGEGRTGVGSGWCGPVPRPGGGSRRRDPGAGASTCGANSPPRRTMDHLTSSGRVVSCKMTCIRSIV